MNEVDRQQFSQKASQRSNIYGVLSSVFSQEPDKSFIKHLLEDKALRRLLAGGGMWDEKFWARSPQEISKDLAVEYTRLFIGPKGHIPPFESIYNFREGESRQIWGTVTVEIKKIIEASGLSFKNDYEGIPDHIGIELEYMQKLVKKEAELWEKNENNSQLLKTIQQEKKFIEEHLDNWIPEFCQKVKQAAKLDFYKNFAEVTRDFINLEKEEMEISLSSFTE